MKNVTITLDEETARWARIEAARRGTSVSKLVGEMLRERRELEASFEAAGRRFLGRSPAPMKSAGESHPTRESLYDRDVLR
ncbi:hypothetical protein [Wenzhouxiangella sp. EGI_FJ10409]|uniref:hypothetical protein n=1 Tax=Wenzhouxiangella sp. EGI_FJ10409 TaxID=3243767 RepID=UPI0035E1569B